MNRLLLVLLCLVSALQALGQGALQFSGEITNRSIDEDTNLTIVFSVGGSVRRL